MQNETTGTHPTTVADYAGDYRREKRAAARVEALLELAGGRLEELSARALARRWKRSQGWVRLRLAERRALIAQVMSDGIIPERILTAKPGAMIEQPERSVQPTPPIDVTAAGTPASGHSRVTLPKVPCPDVLSDEEKERVRRWVSQHKPELDGEDLSREWSLCREYFREKGGRRPGWARTFLNWIGKDNVRHHGPKPTAATAQYRETPDTHVDPTRNPDDARYIEPENPS